MAVQLIDMVRIGAVAVYQQFPQLQAFQLAWMDHFRAQAVIQIMGGVSQGIGDVDNLRLDMPPQIGVEIFGIRAVILGFVLHHPLKHLPGEVQTGKIGIPLFQFGHNTERLFVMVKTAVFQHQAGKGAFTGMAKRGMPKIMRQRDGFRQVFIGPQRPGDGATDLGDFHGVGEAGAVIIALVVNEHLGFIFQSAEGCGMDDAVAVALKNGAVFGFAVRVHTPARHAGVGGITGQRSVFNIFQFHACKQHGLSSITLPLIQSNCCTVLRAA